MASPSIINMDIYKLPPGPPNLDTVGTFYIAFCVTWTTLVFSGMIFLIVNRKHPILKIRGLPLTLAAVTFLHAYWILAQLVYPVGMAMPVLLAYDVQYFFMGLWFPLGVALFHASNSRFLHVAALQKKYTEPPLRKRSCCNGGDTSWLCRFRNWGYSKRILVYIGLGMILQVLLTVGMWIACRKYHPTFGIPGTELTPGMSISQQLLELSRGWEWWPSALWQVIWTWIIAPILLYRAWGIRDTLGWRLQTVGCCISNLHATPMWLISTYVPAFAPINMYFAPSEWIHLSVMMFEVFAVFVPCWQLLKHHRLRKQAIASNTKWETESQATTARGSVIVPFGLLALAEKGYATGIISDDDMKDHLLTMSALDHTLQENPTPLQEFSALRDFSGENIAFLTRTASWKSSWPASPDGDQTRDLFTRALVIYIDFISPRDAEFPLNLSSHDLKRLESVFEKPARILYGEPTGNPATPFEDDWSPRSRGSNSEASSSCKDGMETGCDELANDVANKVQYTGDISESFDLSIFDSAEAHIKYLVLTNTWPKFVQELRRQSSESEESERSDNTEVSQTTIVSRVSDLIRSFL